MASTEGAMICCIRSVASIPPDLRQTDRASETRCKKPEEQNKKVGQWPTRMRTGKARFGGTTGSYGITKGKIAKLWRVARILRYAARIFHKLPPVAKLRRLARTSRRAARIHKLSPVTRTCAVSAG